MYGHRVRSSGRVQKGEGPAGSNPATDKWRLNSNLQVTIERRSSRAKPSPPTFMSTIARAVLVKKRDVTCAAC